MYRTAAWRRHQDQRRINQWRNFFLNVSYWPRDAEPFDSWLYTEANRLRKHTQSCDHHMICLLDRWLNKYRTWRAKINRECERLEVAGVKWRGRW